jgi:O-antigen/teichoic acid export membrane protein
MAASLAIVSTADAATYADFAVLASVVLISSSVARLGADRLFLGEVNATLMRHGPTDAQRHGASLIASSGLSGIIVAALIAGPLSGPAAVALSDPLVMSERLLLAAWIVAESARLVGAEAFRADRMFIWAALAGVGLRALLFAGAIVALGLPGDLSRRECLTAAAGASVVTLLITLLRIGPRYPWWKGRPIAHLRSTLQGHIMMVGASLAAMAIGAADIWIAGATMSSTATAQYALAVTMAAGLAVLSTAIAGGLGPAIAEGIAAGAPQESVRRAVKYVRVTSLLAVAGLIALAMGLEPLAKAGGGAHYSDLTWLVVILASGQVLSTAAGLSGYVLTLGRRYTTVAVNTMGVAAVALVSEAVVAWATHNVFLLAAVSAAATALLPLANNLASHRLLGIRTDALCRAH